jgi:hypothetical protein
MHLETLLHEAQIDELVTVTPGTFGVSIEEFQEIVDQLQVMERRGGISIEKSHVEEDSDGGFVDLILVKRLR